MPWRSTSRGGGGNRALGVAEGVDLLGQRRQLVLDDVEHQLGVDAEVLMHHDIGAGHTATASRSAVTDTSLRSNSGATTSTRRPNAWLNSSAIPATRRSSLPPSGRRSTNMSMSLSWVASPRATDPIILGLTAW